MLEQKTVYIVAGANGSGKTTFAINFSNIKNIEFINADEIAKEYDPNDIQKYKVKAGRIFFKRLKKSLNEENSFVIETTLSGKYLTKIIPVAQSNGFKVVLLYLFLENSFENVNRVKNRVLAGGHNVPYKDIIRRYTRSKILFWNQYKNLVDEWFMFYNGDDKFEIVASNGDIIDEELFDKFKKDLE